jgi:hypothetical protein
VQSPPDQATPSVDEIVARVLARAAERGPLPPARGSGRLAWSDLDARLKGGPSAAADFLRRVRSGGGTFRAVESRTYSLGDFLQVDGSDFVYACYQGLLGRHPDGQGRHHFLSMLLSGRRKTEVLASIRYSAEGRAYGAKVRGLWPHAILAAVLRIPGIGYLCEYALTVVTLPGVARGVRALHAYDAYRRELVVAELTRALRRIEGQAARDRK